jgi:hypothetical protein
MFEPWQRPSETFDGPMMLLDYVVQYVTWRTVTGVSRCFLEHRVVPFYPPPYGPELNLIEIVGEPAKCR